MDAARLRALYRTRQGAEFTTSPFTLVVEEAVEVSESLRARRSSISRSSSLASLKIS
jgi:hypothetical protein